MRILPALLNSTIQQFSDELNTLKSDFNHFSIDIQDGSFVNSLTISTADILAYFSQHSYPKKISFDFDLMTWDYKTSLKDIEKIQQFVTVKNVFLHAGLLEDKVLPKSDLLTIGLALNPPDKVNTLGFCKDLKDIACIQIMMIDSGPQGQPFMAEMLNKVGELRKDNYRGEIFLDGGINHESLPVISAYPYKPDFLCVGSYLCKAGNQQPERIRYLKSVETS